MLRVGTILLLLLHSDAVDAFLYLQILHKCINIHDLHVRRSNANIQESWTRNAHLTANSTTVSLLSGVLLTLNAFIFQILAQSCTRERRMLDRGQKKVWKWQGKACRDSRGEKERRKPRIIVIFSRCQARQTYVTLSCKTRPRFPRLRQTVLGYTFVHKCQHIYGKFFLRRIYFALISRNVIYEIQL